MPQESPNVPPRPEFIPFTIPYLCVSKPYDGKDFWSYPERCGWIVNVKDMQCHVLSTARLNGLPGRWFEAAAISGRAGDKVLMERILTITRHSHLMLSEERSEDGHTLIFKYSYAECRVFHSLEILVHTVGLHLLLHTYMPGFTATEEEGWDRKRIERSLGQHRGRLVHEGIAQLSNLAQDKLEEQGWCESELNLLTYEELAFASLLSRPRIRDHSNCGDTICHAYQTEESTYRTRHVDDGCSCDFVGLDTDGLIAVLSQNKVPRLVITDGLELEVVSENDYPYIALSHVCTSPVTLYAPLPSSK